MISLMQQWWKLALSASEIALSAPQVVQARTARLTAPPGADIEPGRAKKAGQIHGPVMVEAAIFDRQERQRHVLGHLRQARGRTVARTAPADHLAVRPQEGQAGRAAHRP